MREGVATSGEFSFFMTEKGFGTGQATPDHPMLRETKYKTADGEPMIANDLFRVVHDMVAHVRGGFSFSTNGEFNGMLTHASTLPESAWPALFAETFGQNAVYEQTGNYAQQNAYASKIGPEIIRAELAKRGKKSSRDENSDENSDEPLGYQHIKSRPWLLAAVRGSESRAFCPTGEGGGVDNSCGSGEMSPSLHSSSEKVTPTQMAEMVTRDGIAGEDVGESMKLLKTPRRFELVGTLIKTMPSDSVDAGDFSVRTVEMAAPKGREVPEELSDQIASAVQEMYGDAIRYANEKRVSRSLAIDDASMSAACFTAQMASGVAEYPDILDADIRVMRRQEVFDTLISEGLSQEKAAEATMKAAALYSSISDRIIVNADNSVDYINSVAGTAVSTLDEDTEEWSTPGGAIPFYSTTQLGHSIAHEDGHRIHYQAIRKSLGILLGTRLTEDEFSRFYSSIQTTRTLIQLHVAGKPEVAKKIASLSGYANTNPFEFVAEYYTALALGKVKRDSDLDEAMGIMGFPKEMLPAGKKSTKKGGQKK